MNDPLEIGDEKPAPEGGDAHLKKQPSVAVTPSALVVDNSVIPIYAVLGSQSKQTRHAWYWVIATAIFCIWTVSFTYAVLISTHTVPRAYNWSPAKTILLVNIAAQVSVLLIVGMIGAIYDPLCWSLMLRSDGTTIRTFTSTKKDSGLFEQIKMILIPGTHRKWNIMRIIIILVGWVVGLIPLANVDVDKVFTTGKTFPVIAGIADMHTAVSFLKQSGVLTNLNPQDTSASKGETGINMMISSVSRSILTDPTFVIDVAPLRCTESDCHAVFLPGGMTLLRQPNGKPVDFSKQPADETVIIVHDALGYQMEFLSAPNHNFDPSECNMTGFAVSSFYSCFNLNNDVLTAGFTICPFEQMAKATCESDKTWTQTLSAKVSVNIFQRMATVAYDRGNFSILSIEKISDPLDGTITNLVDDFYSMFDIMYPSIKIVESDIAGVIANFDTIWEDLAYWASVYCVQSELAAAQWLLENNFPTWITGSEDVLKGLLAIPIQFGTMLWQFIDTTHLPKALTANVNAAVGQVAYRTRSPLWTVGVFAAFALCLIVWAMICLLYVQLVSNRIADEEHTEAVQAAFQQGNPFDEVEEEGLWHSLRLFYPRLLGKSQPVTKDADYVVARKLRNDVVIAVNKTDG